MPLFQAAKALTNRSAADAEAVRLLGLVRLPGGARPSATTPSQLSGPVVGLPVIGSQVDEARFWRIALPFRQTLEWLHAHPPNGLREYGRADGTAPGVRSGGYAYDGPSTSGQLQVGAAMVSATESAIRADAIVTWVDLTPVRDDAVGQRLRVTLAGGCPASDAGKVGVSNNGADLDHAMLPAAEPSVGLVCRYSGLNGQRFTSSNPQHLDATAARRLADVGRKISLAHLDGAVSSCPADDGSVVVVALSYPGRTDVDLWIQPNGCTRIANGHVAAQPGDLLPLLEAGH